MSAGYNSSGLRVWKQNAAGRTYFLYANGAPICELDANGNVTGVNTFGLCGLASRHTSTGSNYYAFDDRGNVSQRLDAAGNVLGCYCFNAFGQRIGTDTTSDPFLCLRTLLSLLLQAVFGRNSGGGTVRARHAKTGKFKFYFRLTSLGFFGTLRYRFHDEKG